VSVCVHPVYNRRGGIRSYKDGVVIKPIEDEIERTDRTQILAFGSLAGRGARIVPNRGLSLCHEFWIVHGRR